MIPVGVAAGWRWRDPRRTLVMGILNLSPDSFSGDGVPAARGDSIVAAAVARAAAMLADGADLIDVGGESTRPGAEPVPLAVELDRVVPVVEALVAARIGPLSVDTYKPRVAEAALAAGAMIVNDITGLQGDPEVAAVAARFGAAVVAMHMRGRPRSMQEAPRYDDLIGEVREFLERSIRIGVDARISSGMIALDPGIGFGKTLQHNLDILRRLAELRVGEHALVVGTSRKSFIGRITGTTPDQRVEGTAATVALAIAAGADVVRVHDVREIARVARMADAIVRGWDG